MSGINSLLKPANVFVSGISIHKGYRCYDPATKWFHIARHVSFFENVPCYLPFLDTIFHHSCSYVHIHFYPPLPVSLTKSFPSSVDVNTTDTLLLMIALTSPSDQPPPCQNPPRNLILLPCASANNTTYSLEFSSFVPAFHSLHELKPYSEVVKSAEWQYAMNEKLPAFQYTHTWDLVPCHLVQIQ